MEDHNTEAAFLLNALVFLSAAVVLVPIAKRLNLGSVLGYLFAGILIGPILQFITDGESILHFAEFGIVLLLFVVGLELRPALLWRLRTPIFGIGTAQMLVTGLVLSGLLYALDYNWRACLVIGFGLALSSTAFALQILGERNELSDRYGQKSFAILLAQDLAIVPLIAMIAFLAPWANEGSEFSFRDVGIAIGALATLILVGRYCLNPLFRILAASDAREIMTAAALLVVLGAAELMDAVGLSMALGAFLAGVLLAESTFRHQLEADIEPFRGLLLGLFFIAVGLSLDLDVLIDSWLLIVIAAPLLMIIKAAILYGILRAVGSPHDVSAKVSCLLPQAGEFAFVLFSQANDVFLISSTVKSELIAIVTLSMALTPLSFYLCNRFLIPQPSEEDMEEDYSDAQAKVMVVGFGRFGQVVGQLLLAEGLDATLIDKSVDRIREAQKFGFRIYYGDGRRADVLRAAGAADADLVICCVDGRENIDAVIAAVKTVCPVAKLCVRSYDRQHTLDLWDQDIDFEVREVYESAFALGTLALKSIGIDEDRVAEVIDDVRKRDRERLELQKAEGIYAGADMMHRKTVSPEPLVTPKRDAKSLTPETEEITSSDKEENRSQQDGQDAKEPAQ